MGIHFQLHIIAEESSHRFYIPAGDPVLSVSVFSMNSHLCTAHCFQRQRILKVVERKVNQMILIPYLSVMNLACCLFPLDPGLCISNRRDGVDMSHLETVDTQR